MLFSHLGVNCYWVAACVALRNRLLFPIDFLGGCFTYSLFVFVFSRIWLALGMIDKLPLGYCTGDCIWYTAIAEITLFSFGRSFSEISDTVKTGQIVYSINRPYNFVLYHLSQKLGSALFETLLLLTIGSLTCFLLSGPLAVMTLFSWSLLMVSVFLAGILRCLIHILLASIAFWFEENIAFFWLFQNSSLLAGTLFPLECLPAYTRSFIYWTPLPYLAYAPAKIAVHFQKEEALRLVVIQLLWLVVVFILCQFAISQGRKHLMINGG